MSHTQSSVRTYVRPYYCTPECSCQPRTFTGFSGSGLPGIARLSTVASCLGYSPGGTPRISASAEFRHGPRTPRLSKDHADPLSLYSAKIGPSGSTGLCASLEQAKDTDVGAGRCACPSQRSGADLPKNRRLNVAGIWSNRRLFSTKLRDELLDRDVSDALNWSQMLIEQCRQSCRRIGPHRRSQARLPQTREALPDPGCKPANSASSDGERASRSHLRPVNRSTPSLPHQARMGMASTCR